jgi:hypothetical protein
MAKRDQAMAVVSTLSLSEQGGGAHHLANFVDKLSTACFQAGNKLFLAKRTMDCLDQTIIFR